VVQTFKTVNPMLRLSEPCSRAVFCESSNIISSLSSLTVNKYYRSKHTHTRRHTTTTETCSVVVKDLRLEDKDLWFEGKFKDKDLRSKDLWFEGKFKDKVKDLRSKDLKSKDKDFPRRLSTRLGYNEKWLTL